MLDTLEKVPMMDPLVIPEQKAVIDRILNENRHLPGSVMVILNELQSQIGFVSPRMQAYVAKEMRVPSDSPVASSPQDRRAGSIDPDCGT